MCYLTLLTNRLGFCYGNMIVYGSHDEHEWSVLIKQMYLQEQFLEI